MDTTISTLTPTESALATFGHDSAALSAEHAAEWASATGNLYELPDGLTWPQYRASSSIGEPTPDSDGRDEVIGGVPVRIIEPLTRPTRGTYLYLHGGGWCLGSHRTTDSRLRAIAEHTGLRAISVGYRQPPENPFPACLDDCVTVADRLDGSRLIGGDSAGAHLAALVLQRRPGSWLGALLTIGVYDLAGTPSAGSRLDTPVSMLLPGIPKDRWRDPKYSPLYGDLAGMPPALFTVGTRDSLLDDTLWMAARWSQVAPTRLEVVAGAGHAYTLSDLPARHETETLYRDWLTKQIDAAH